jgi:hypothetical protein
MAMYEQRFCTIEQKLDSSMAPMDSIEDLCCQLKSSTDCISGQLGQLMSDLHQPNSELRDSPPRAAKAAKHL